MIKFIKDKSAVASIEAALLLLPFILFIAVIAEGCVLAYQAMLLDNTLDRASKYAASFKGEVKAQFDIFLSQEESKMLKFAHSITPKIKFCNDIISLGDDKCQSEENKQSQIAIFELNYQIRPLFILSRTKIAKELISSKATRYIE